MPKNADDTNGGTRLAVSALLLAVLLFLQACGNTNQSANQAAVKPKPEISPSPTNPNQAASEDEKDLQEEENPDNRVKARAAVLDYVKTNLPKQKIEGVSLLSYAGNLYIASVDLSQGEKRQTISLIVRMYVKEGGETYWRADKLSEDDKRLLISRKAYQFNSTKRALQEAEAENSELSDEIAARDEQLSRDDPDDEPPDDPRN